MNCGCSSGGQQSATSPVGYGWNSREQPRKKRRQKIILKNAESLPAMPILVFSFPVLIPFIGQFWSTRRWKNQNASPEYTAGIPLFIKPWFRANCNASVVSFKNSSEGLIYYLLFGIFRPRPSCALCLLHLTSHKNCLQSGIHNDLLCSSVITYNPKAPRLVSPSSAEWIYPSWMYPLDVHLSPEDRANRWWHVGYRRIIQGTGLFFSKLAGGPKYFEPIPNYRHLYELHCSGPVRTEVELVVVYVKQARKV